MKKVILFSIIFVFVCSIFLSGCISSSNTTPTAMTAALNYQYANGDGHCRADSSADPHGYCKSDHDRHAGSELYDDANCLAYVGSDLYSELYIYPPELNSTSTVVTGISGNLTNVNTGDQISGNVNSDEYQFSHVSSGSYDLVVDVQYTVYYSNNSTSDRSTRITDNFGVNGNVDKIYQLN